MRCTWKYDWQLAVGRHDHGMRILLPAGHFTHTGGHTRSIRTRIRILTFRFLRNPSVARCRGRDGAQGDEVGRRVRYAAYWSRGVE